MLNAVGGLVASLTGYIYLVRNSAGVLGIGLSLFIRHNQRLYQKYKHRLKK